MDNKVLSKKIKQEALRLGFADCGFAHAGSLPGHAEKLRSWLEKGYHAGMGYMVNHFEKRTDPTLLVEGTRTVISLIYPYYTERKQQDPEAPILSKYAYGTDYHFVMKDKLRKLFLFIRSLRPEAEGRLFVDSAPVLDRAWAVKAGLGWIGKNSNLISRKAGSFVFIGEILINIELPHEAVPENDFCGSCTRCIEACPTEAILPERTIDSNRCISYHTIEHKDLIPEELEGKLENRVFGCDICQDVCPWNRQALLHTEPEFEPSVELLQLNKKEWASMEEEQYERLFEKSPVKRAGLEKLRKTITFLNRL